MKRALKLSPAWLLAGVSVAVAAAFVGADVYAQREMLAIDGNALALVDSIAPRIDDLTSLRGAIYGMDRAARDAVAGRVAPAEAQQQADRERGKIAGRARSWLQTPPLGRAVDAFEQRASRALKLAEQGDLPSARKEIESLEDALATVDAIVHEQVSSSASDAARDGARIARLRRHAASIAYLLNAVAALLSFSMVAIAFRVTRQNERLEEDRARAVGERNILAELRAAELEQFAARVAHDLKNPIAAVALRTVLARRPDASEPMMRDALGKVDQSLRRLVSIIDGLLDFARSGGEPDRTAATPLQPILEEVVGEIQGDAERVGAEVHITTVDEKAAVACPAATLMSILENLVRNAVKFVVEGRGPHVVLIRGEKRDDLVHVEIEDTGPGVPLDQASAIFEPYVRGRGMHQPGLGIGLATVKRLVEAYGGHVGVRSTPGVGSCFWFELPTAIGS